MQVNVQALTHKRLGIIYRRLEVRFPRYTLSFSGFNSEDCYGMCFGKQKWSQNETEARFPRVTLSSSLLPFSHPLHATSCHHKMYGPVVRNMSDFSLSLCNIPLSLPRPHSWHLGLAASSSVQYSTAFYYLNGRRASGCTRQGGRGGRESLIKQLAVPRQVQDDPRPHARRPAQG